jgi:hypothetical protein
MFSFYDKKEETTFDQKDEHHLIIQTIYDKLIFLKTNVSIFKSPKSSDQSSGYEGGLIEFNNTEESK